MPTWIQNIPLPYLVPIATLLGCVLTVAITVVTARLTVTWTLRRFYAERWWEKKAEAYERIIEALFHLKEHFEDYLKEHRKDISSDEEKERNKASGAARRELRKAAEMGAYIISPKATELVKLALTPSVTNPEAEAWETLMQEAGERYGRGLKAITEEARKDLRIGRQSNVKNSLRTPRCEPAITLRN